MKVMLYHKKQNFIKTSGIGRAYRQQAEALKLNDITLVNTLDECDVVHYNTVFSDSYRSLKKAKKRGVPVVVHAHSTKEDYLNSFNFANITKGWFYKRMYKMYSNADVIITPSEYSKSLIEGYGWTNCNIHPISNGLIVKEYEKSEEKEQQFLNYFGLKKGEKVIIGIGLLFVRKGLPDFIEIARSFPKITFIWFGHLNKLAQTKVIKKAIKNKPNNVKMPGYISGDIIKGALTYANALLFPSYEETEGIVVLEAMASKTPVIVRNIPVYDQFEDGVNVLKANNNKEFVEHVEMALNNDLKEIINNAYEDILKKDLKYIGAQIKKVYEEVIESKK